MILLQGIPLAASLTSVRHGSDSTDLKAVFAEKYPLHGEQVKAFRRAHGDKKVGEITVDMVRNSYTKNLDITLLDCLMIGILLLDNKCV